MIPKYIVKPMIKKILFLSTLLITLISSAFASTTFDKLTLPIDLTTGFDIPYAIPAVNLTIENTQIPLLLDTGFGSNADLVISDKLAKRLNLHYTGKKDCSLSQSGKDCFDEVIIPSVKLQNQVFHNLVGFVSHGEWGGAQYYKNFKKTIAYDNGVITLKFLKQFNILLDYKNNVVELYDINTRPYEILNRWDKIKFNIVKGNIVSPLNFKNHKVNLIWDTAFLPSQLKKSLFGQTETEQCPSNMYGFFDFNKHTKCFYSKNYPIVSSLIPNAVFAVKDIGVPDFVPIDGFVGSDYIYDHVIFFDFKSSFIFIK